jgi:hypothetical protein
VKVAEKKLETLKDGLKAKAHELKMLMENSGLQSVKHSGTTLYLNNNFYAGVKKGEQDLAFAWLKCQDLGYIIKPTVNSRSLSSAIKEEISDLNPEQRQEYIEQMKQAGFSVKDDKVIRYRGLKMNGDG